MLNKLLDEVYWEELEETMTPAVMKIKDHALIQTKNLVIDRYVLHLFITLINQGLEKLSEKRFVASLEELDQVIPFAKNNLSALKNHLLFWIDCKVRMIYKCREEQVRSITRQEAIDETVQERLDTVNKVKDENNLQVIIEFYQKLHREFVRVDTQNILLFISKERKKRLEDRKTFQPKRLK